MDVMNHIIAQAKADKQRIILPEGTEIRTLIAADRLIADQVATIILIGKPEEIHSIAESYRLSHIKDAIIVNPKDHPKKEEYAALLLALREKKGMTAEKAAIMVEDPLYLASLMVKAGDADGEVAGALNRTGDVLRPALQIIKTTPGVSVVSGAFLMILKDKSYGDDGILMFADCAVIPDPTADELAQIAISTAQTTKSLIGIDPRVALLSFSTRGSASHPRVDKVAEATKKAKELAPNLVLDGELQADAAIVESIGKSKAPGSPVAGKANVLVFPSLEVGNIAYKLVQRFAGAEAIGPILQGIAAPVNDLSRGCSSEDIYNMVAVSSVQSIGLKALKK